MITYRMDLTNFLQGTRAGVRIVPGAGLKTDFNEFAPDADTLGLWHLHDGGCQGEGTGLADASGGGHTLTNSGASPEEDGYRFARAEADYMTAPFAAQPQRSQMTLESWVRGWAVPAGSGGFIADFRYSGALFAIWAIRASPPSGSFIRVWLYTTGGYTATWTGAAADAVLASPDPWHVAAVLAAPAPLELYVNGVRRAVASGSTPLPAADYVLNLGKLQGQSAYNLDAVLDEVRLSAAARYSSAGFAAQRLLAAGTYTGITFDTGRPGTTWLGLESVHSLPAGTSLGWEVRAADATDGSGQPLAPWQAYGGPPSLPRGRNFQWRATLTGSADRLASPTVERIDALASEAGYDLFHATGDGPETLDYATRWASVGPGVTQLVTAPLDAGAVHWFGVRPVDDREIACPTTQSEARLELNEQGSRVAARPAGALAVSARPLPAACVRLSWSYRTGSSGTVPQVFRIFGDGGTGQINYSTPLGEVPYRESQAGYAWTSGPLATGVQHQLAVCAIAAGDTWDEQPAVALVTPDAAPPGQVDSLEAEVIL